MRAVASPEEARSFDGYRLVRLLGRGGMGEVWLAQDTLLDRPVAIKFIAAADVGDEARQRFLVEGRAIARLQHANVVSVYRVGELDGRPYLVSEYVGGQTLDRLDLPLSAAEATRIGIEVARGLTVAHRRGVVHRDIKPGNVILADDGSVKILDFGIARLVPAEAVPSRPTLEALPGSPTPDGIDDARWSGETPTARTPASAPVPPETWSRSRARGVRAAAPDSAPPETWSREDPAGWPSRSPESTFGRLGAGSPSGVASPFEEAPVTDPLAVTLSPGSADVAGLDRSGRVDAALGRTTRADVGPRAASRSPDVARISPTGATSLTRPGALMGTPAFMAPELWRGEAATFRSDVYALGALLYVLCSGRPPHVADTLGGLRDQVEGATAPPLVSVAAVAPELSDLVARCLARDPQDRFASANEVRGALTRLASEGREAVPQANPYRGLYAFEREHRDLFFGRDAETLTVLERLRAEPFVLVAGDSGTGKSSLCRAGVLPRLGARLDQERTWTSVAVVPGRHPVTALAAALAPLLGDEGALARAITEDACDVARRLRAELAVGRGLVVFVDQLEELVTVAQPEERAAATELLSWLAAPSASVRLLAAVRGDFLSRVATLPRIGDLASRALYFLRPLNEERIGEVIVGPALALGVGFESPALVESLVRATLGGGGGLPLLQFALHELWDALPAGTRTLTASVVEAIGGVTGALTRHADRVLAQMSAAERRAARPVLLRLVTAEGTRAVRSEDELAVSDGPSRAVLDALVRGRLVVARDTPEGPGYEIAHEALIRGWATLAGWLDEDAGARVVHERLRAAVSEWERLGRARDALWSARQVAELGAVALSPREQAFVTASRRAARRARWIRVAAWVSPLCLAAGVYAATRVAASVERTRRVDAELGLAREMLSAARVLRDDVDALRVAALNAFDSAESDAESKWSEAISAREIVDPAYGQAARHLEAALLLDPTRSEVRTLFADLLYERALVAEAQRETTARGELLTRLEVYDDGSRRARWDAPGRVVFQVRPEGTTLSLYRFERQDDGPPREVPVDAPGGLLPQGAYLLVGRAPGHTETRKTFALRRGEALRVSMALPRDGTLPAGFVYVPPGRFGFGSAAEDGLRRDYFHTVPLHDVSTPGYLIARHETTFAEWIEFLEALPPEAREVHAPRVGKGGFNGALSLGRLADGRWRLELQPADRRYVVTGDEPLVYAGRSRHAAHDWRRLPVVGIAVADALRYTRWLDESGRVPGARLCTDLEWERAARGADGREYPHGARTLQPDDANVDVTYDKVPEAMGPDAVGTHPASRSPYGLSDMAGNVWEWTRSSLTPPGAPPEYPARGGSFNFGPNTARVTGRELTEPSFRDISVGLRVCADFAPP